MRDLVIPILLCFFVLALFALVLWHSKHTTYKCPKCNKKFKISFFEDLFGPHWLTRKGGFKYLRCPNCNVRVKAREV